MSTKKKGGKKQAKKKEEGIVENVIKLIRTSVLAGLGMALLGEEKIEKWATKMLVEKNKAIRLAKAKRTIEKLGKSNA